jgi:glycosyltransferase involved in cell wall biosynthesis
VRVTLVANTLCYPEGGGHAWVYLNWALGLRAAGCDVIWLEGIGADSTLERQREQSEDLRRRLEPFGLDGEVAICTRGNGPVDALQLDGCIDADAAADASDLLLDLGYLDAPDVVAKFRRSALVDIDPGRLQLWMSDGDMTLPPHDVYFTLAENVGDGVPDLGLEWHHTLPCVALEWWDLATAGADAAFTTVSHWNASEWMVDDHGIYANNKRAGFMPFIDLPALTGVAVELALCFADGRAARARALPCGRGGRRARRPRAARLACAALTQRRIHGRGLPQLHPLLARRVQRGQALVRSPPAGLAQRQNRLLPGERQAGRGSAHGGKPDGPGWRRPAALPDSVRGRAHAGRCDGELRPPFGGRPRPCGGALLRTEGGHEGSGTSTRMRIAYVCSDIDVPVLGTEGCSLHVRDLIAALAGAGHEVLLLCANVGDRDAGAIHADVHEIAPRGAQATAWSALEEDPAVLNHHLERDLRSLAWNGWLLEQGSELLESYRPNVVYERFALFGWAGLELARRFGIPHLLEVNAPLWIEQLGYERFTLMATAEKLEWDVVSGSNAVLAVSPWLRAWALEHGAAASSTHVIPNGVDGSLFAADRLDGLDARARYGLSESRVVGYVGSFQSWHHVRGLLAAFAPLARADPLLRLVLVGDGPERSAAAHVAGELGIDGAVTFTGHVGHAEAVGLIAAMDVAVVPYARVEDFYFSPLKLFECMAAGKPTVAAAIGQIVDVVDHGRTGVLYPPGDDAALGSALVELLADPQRAGEIGAAARREIVASRTWDAVAREVVQVAERMAVPVR